MSWEREKDYKPLKTIEEVESMIEEWGPLLASFLFLVKVYL